MNCRCLLMFGVLITGVLIGPGLHGARGNGQDTHPATTAALDSSWRLTKYGWQDSTYWYVDTFSPAPTISAIHPALFAALLLTVVIIAMIWASSEWEFAQLFVREAKTPGDPANADSMTDCVRKPVAPSSSGPGPD